MNPNLKIYEILVPTEYGDTRKPISTKHHKNWDILIRNITGGLTIFGIARGQWIHGETKEFYEERVIPVRVACEENQIEKLIAITLCHYRQKAVMFYLLSDKVEIRYNKLI